MTMNDTENDQNTYTLRLIDMTDEPRRYLLPIAGYEDMPLVTLEKAIQPIGHLFPEIQAKVYVAKRNCESMKGPLTQDGAASIMLYTMAKSGKDPPFYELLNATLRSDKPDRSDQLQPWFSYLKLFITALSYIPSYRGTVYRGVKLDLGEYYEIGKEFVWWGFSSCTKSLSVLQSEVFLGQEGKRTMFIIDCFSGKEIRHYSYFEREDEVLLVAARQFIVVNSLQIKPDLRIIQIKEIELPYPSLKLDSSISSTLERFQSITRSTDTDDMPWNIKSDQETLTDDLSTEKEEENQLKKSIDVAKTSLPTLTNSAVVSNTNASIAIVTPSDLDKLASAEDDKGHTQVKTMTFKNKLITEKSLPTIAEDIRRNLDLEILCFRNNALKDIAFNHLLQTINTRKDLKLFIIDNSITDESAKFLTDFLSKNPQAIVQLHLEKNRLTSHGVQILAQALATIEESGLRALSFSGNQHIDDKCIDDVIHLCKHNQRLRSIYLDKCNLSDEGKQRLKSALVTKKALYLQL